MSKVDCIIIFRLTILSLLILSLSSCLSFYRTDSGGVRLSNSAKFEYNREMYSYRDFSMIDTNAYYMIDSMYDFRKTENPERKVNDQICRFFGGGQVLFFYGIDTLDFSLLNDSGAGIPGYFTTDEKFLKIDMFQNINGGQTGKYFGYVRDNGDIVFYEQRPETYSHNHDMLVFRQLKDFGVRSIWKKYPSEGLINYKPNW